MKLRNVLTDVWSPHRTARAAPRDAAR